MKPAIYKTLAQKSGEKKFTTGIDLGLPNQVALLRSNANVLEQRAVTLRKSLSDIEEQLAPLRKEVDALRQEVANVKRAVGETRVRLKAEESHVPRDADAVAARQRDYEANDRAWTARRAELSVKEAQIHAEREKNTPLKARIQMAEQTFETAWMELRAKEQLLSDQENTFIRATRQQASEAGSYAALYRLIGQQLTTADRLLEDHDVSRRRIGLNFAREACRHASDAAEDGWLAARICEAYLWPHLDLADYAAGSKERTFDVLQLCRSIFLARQETDNAARNYALMITNAPSAQHADTTRLEFADLLEQIGRNESAATVLREIREPSLLAAAQEKLGRMNSGARP